MNEQLAQLRALAARHAGGSSNQTARARRMAMARPTLRLVCLTLWVLCMPQK